MSATTLGKRNDEEKPERVKGPLYVSGPGLSRPWTDDGRYPVPWNALYDQLGKLIPHRKKLTEFGAHCQVCGMRLRRHGRAFMLYTGNDETEPNFSERPATMPANTKLHAMDGGLLHRICLRIALRWCPHLKKLRRQNELALFRVPTCIGIEIDASLCEWMPLPDEK